MERKSWPEENQVQTLAKSKWPVIVHVAVSPLHQDQLHTSFAQGQVTVSGIESDITIPAGSGPLLQITITGDWKSSIAEGSPLKQICISDVQVSLFLYFRKRPFSLWTVIPYPSAFYISPYSIQSVRPFIIISRALGRMVSLWTLITALMALSNHVQK